MTSPVRTVSSLIRPAVADGRGAPAELIMKIIFIKAGPCCEAASCAAVSMPEMRRTRGQSTLNSGKRRTVQW
jgi:hypothetical protein